MWEEEEVEPLPFYREQTNKNRLDSGDDNENELLVRSDGIVERHFPLDKRPVMASGDLIETIQILNATIDAQSVRYEELMQENETMKNLSEERDFAYIACRAELKALRKEFDQKTEELARARKQFILEEIEQKQAIAKPTVSEQAIETVPLETNDAEIQTISDKELEDYIQLLKENVKTEQEHSKSLHSEFLTIKTSFENRISDFEMEIVDLESEVRKLNNDLRARKITITLTTKYEESLSGINSEVVRLQLQLSLEQSERKKDNEKWNSETLVLREKICELEIQLKPYLVSDKSLLDKSVGTMEDISDDGQLLNKVDPLKSISAVRNDAPETSTFASNEIPLNYVSPQRDKLIWLQSDSFHSHYHSPISNPVNYQQDMPFYSRNGDQLKLMMEEQLFHWQKKEKTYIDKIEYLMENISELRQILQGTVDGSYISDYMRNLANAEKFIISDSNNQLESDSNLFEQDQMNWYVPTHRDIHTTNHSPAQWNSSLIKNSNFPQSIYVTPPSSPPKIMSRPILQSHHNFSIHQNLLYPQLAQQNQSNILMNNVPQAEVINDEIMQNPREFMLPNSIDVYIDEKSKSKHLKLAAKNSKNGDISKTAKATRQPNLVAPFITQVRPKSASSVERSFVPHRPNGEANVDNGSGKGSTRSKARPGRKVVGYNFPVRGSVL